MRDWYVRNNNSSILASTLGARYESQEITISVDPSKTNTAVIVKELGGDILDVFEISADHIKLDAIETYGRYIKYFFRTLFKDAVVRYSAIEDIITKKDQNVSNTHQVRFALTYIFTTIYNELDDLMHITAPSPVIIPNTLWKREVLGDFNKLNGKKNSVEYLKSIRHPYALYSDDVTDAVCIAEYLHRKFKIQGNKKPKQLEMSSVDYTLIISAGGTVAREHTTLYEHCKDSDVISELNFIASSQNASTAVYIVKTKDFPVSLYSPEKSVVFGNIVGEVTELNIQIKVVGK